MPDGLGSFKYNVNNGNQVELIYTFDMNQAIIGSEYYDALKNFHKEIINKHSEKIVFKKE